jgi:hypothetical protein
MCEIEIKVMYEIEIQVMYEMRYPRLRFEKGKRDRENLHYGRGLRNTWWMSFPPEVKRK